MMMMMMMMRRRRRNFSSDIKYKKQSIPMQALPTYPKIIKNEISA